jgi:hypothetical protein
MKSLLLYAAFGLGSLGLIGGLPSQAKASWLSEALHAQYDPYYYGADYQPGYVYPYYYSYYSPTFVYPSYWYSTGYYNPGVSYWWGSGPRYYGGWHGHWNGYHNVWHGGSWYGGHQGAWHGGHDHHG